MIRTKSYITREIKKLEADKDRLNEELNLLNGMVKQVGQMPFTSTKRVIKHELTIIEGKLSFAKWIENTSEKSLPKIKENKKKKRKEEKKKNKNYAPGFDLKVNPEIVVYPKQKQEPVKSIKK
jgi:hypothetical protein